MTSSLLRKDKKIVMRIMFLVLLCAVIITVIVPEAFEITSYFVLYILIGLLIFFISPRWICTVTLFYVFYTISVGCGQLFISIENYNILYNNFFIVIGGLSAMFLGYVINIKFKILKLPKTKKVKFNTAISWKTMLYISYILATFACSIYFISNRNILFGNLNDGRIDAARGNGILLYIMKLHIMIIPLMYEEYIKQRISACIFLSLSIFASLQLLTIGFRTPFALMLAVIIIMGVYKERIPLKKCIPIGIGSFIFLIVYGVYRNGTNITSIYFLARNQLFIGAQNLNYVYRTFPHKVPFQKGYTYFINLIMLKPGPDLDFTLWLKQMLGLSFSGGGVTPTILGEFYMNFGNLGIFSGMFILGVIIAKVDKWVIKGEFSFWKAFIMLNLATSCSGGIANVYLNPLILGLYYCVILRLSSTKKYIMR